MDQLDLLKKDWKKQDADLPKYSFDELSKLIHKKSSSIVKWIFIISVLEFVIPHTLYLFSGYGKFSSNGYEELGLTNFVAIFFPVFFTGILYFIYRFYKNYRGIAASSTSKKLMTDIIKTRRVVKHYIWYNLFGVAFLTIIMLQKVFSGEEFLDKIPEGTSMVLVWIIALFGLAFMLLITWLFYQLLYGILLRRLKKNYNELLSNGSAL